VPVIVVGCKLDTRDEQQISLEQVMTPIMQQFREIETCIECSALRQIQVSLLDQSESISLPTLVLKPMVLNNFCYAFRYQRYSIMHRRQCCTQQHRSSTKKHSR
jgi:predicted DCC family thiol-disulfide oxidoreductase YuxK